MKSRITYFLRLASAVVVAAASSSALAQFHASSVGVNGVVSVDSHDTYYDGSDGHLSMLVPIPAGATALQFRVTGGVITDSSNRLASGDGLYANGQTPYNFSGTQFAGTYQGTPVGSTTGIDPSLFGVFFQPGFTGTPAPSLNYRSDSGTVPDPRTLPVSMPSLNQPFYIGDGFTGNNQFITSDDSLVPAGTMQTISIPAGAQYLLLGIGADILFGDNQDGVNSVTAFRVHVFDNGPLPPPPCTADFNHDGVLDPDDLADYITAYFDGCS